MRPKNLPPLEVGQAYRAQDFESFEYVGAALTGSKAILRLHLKNKTTIDLPTSDDQLLFLMNIASKEPPMATAVFDAPHLCLPSRRVQGLAAGVTEVEHGYVVWTQGDGYHQARAASVRFFVGRRIK